MDPGSPKGPSVIPKTATFTQLMRKVTGPMAPRQARPLALMTLLLIPACSAPGQLNPRLLGRDISGAAQEARLPPPGLDRPFPNLASVPPIPERPNPMTRLAITQGLQAERDLLATPLPDRRADTILTEGAAAGQPPIPARPPAPPALARAPAIPWTLRNVTPAAAPGQSTPTPEAAPESIAPGDVPALPSADLLGAPPPLPSVLAPRR